MMGSDLRSREVEALARALEALTDGYVDPVFLIDASGVIRGANRALSARGPIPHDAFVGSRFEQWAYPDDRCVLLAEFDRALAGETRRFRTFGSTGDDASRAEITYSPVRVDDAVVAVLGYAMPIAQLEERERHQREADDLLRIAGELASFGAWSIVRETQELRLTPEAGRILGFDGATPLTLADAIDLFAAVNGDEIAAKIAECFENGTPVDSSRRSRASTDGAGSCASWARPSPWPLATPSASCTVRSGTSPTSSNRTSASSNCSSGST